MHDMNGRYVIAGVGEAPSGRVGDKGHWEMCLIAAKAAVADAGLTKNDIDGVICIDSMAVPHARRHIVLCEHLGIVQAPFVEMLSKGGASPTSGLLMAMTAIEAGLATSVLVVGVDNVLTGQGRQGALEAGPVTSHNLEFEIPYGMYMMVEYAMFARKWMTEFGWKPEEIARVSIAARNYARMHPGALLHEKPALTVDDVMESRMISSPLRMLMCSVFSDGGGAFVVTSAERSKDKESRPITVSGIASANTYYFFEKWPDIVNFPAEMIGKVSREAIAVAGVAYDDIDVIGVPDPIAPSVPMVLQSAGFCPKGEGGMFLEDGFLGPGGKRNVNTHGGSLSFGLPGSAAQWPHFIEVCKQLQGRADERQVSEASLGFVYNRSGAGSQHAAAVLRRD
jgi:acetyl-CoA acetyltransferase